MNEEKNIDKIKSDSDRVTVYWRGYAAGSIISLGLTLPLTFTFLYINVRYVPTRYIENVE